MLSYCTHNKIICYSTFQLAVASFVDDVHLDPFVGRVGLHIRGTRRMGVRSQSNSRPFGSRHHHVDVFPADFRSFPAASWLVEETDFQLDPLAGRKRRSHIRQWVAYQTYFRFNLVDFRLLSYYTQPWFCFMSTVLTIFFAVTLSKAELPAWMDWILVAYVGFYVIIHLILSVSTNRTRCALQYYLHSCVSYLYLSVPIHRLNIVV